MVTFDTNIFIRFFTGDKPEDADKVEKVISAENAIYVSDIVFTEIEYVLRRLYRLEKDDILKAYSFILSNPKFVYSSYVSEAINLFKKNNISISDCFVIASSRGKLVSFDKKILKVDRVESYW
jgi:predicted nucleic-acid-binding protein